MLMTYEMLCNYLFMKTTLFCRAIRGHHSVYALICVTTHCFLFCVKANESKVIKGDLNLQRNIAIKSATIINQNEK